MSIGVVYVIGAPNSGVVKIGRSTNLPTRFTMIQTGCPFEVEVRFSVEGASRLEHQLHAEFGQFRTYGEWFDFGELDPVTEVAGAVRRLQPIAVSESERQTMREQLSELKLLRVESAALQNVAIAETERLVVRALNLSIGPSEVARLAGVTDSYVRTLRRKANIPPHPSYAHLKPPAPLEDGPNSGILDDLGVTLP